METNILRDNFTVNGVINEAKVVFDFRQVFDNIILRKQLKSKYLYFPYIARANDQFFNIFKEFDLFLMLIT